MQNTPDRPVENLAIATIIEVDGTHIVAELDVNLLELSRIYRGDLYPIGQFGSILKIHFGRRVLYAYVSRLRMKSDFDRERGIQEATRGDARVIEADLFGEAEWEQSSEDDKSVWRMRFERGVSTFPLPQQRLYLTPRLELYELYGQQADCAFELGEHVGVSGAKCFADINALACKHTAILGSTGAGKSAAVAAVIHGIVDLKANEQLWSPRIVILDPHDEYSSAFSDNRKLSTDDGTLLLPYWLLSFEETLSLIIGKSEYAATSQTNILRNALINARIEGALELGIDTEGITADSPIPYRLGDPTGLDIFGEREGVKEEIGLVGKINAQRPEGSRSQSNHSEYAKIINKLASLVKDSRLAFMMRSWDGLEDPIASIAGQFLAGDEPVRIVDLSSLPNEVAGAASAATARLLFSIKLWQTSEERASTPVVLVCEEAHRYVPNRGDAQYAAAQDAIRRIAKEGRKYGIGLVLVSQRPSDVEPTVLSQCNSWIVLRITNEADRSHVKSVLPDSLSGLTSVLSGLRRREAIVVGLATVLPSRVLIRQLTDEQLPQSHDIDFVEGWQKSAATTESLEKVGMRWRYQNRRLGI